MTKLSKIAGEDLKFRNSISGLFDISIGLAFIIAGFAFLFDAVAVTAGFYLPVFLIITVLKQKVVYPRIGYVEHKGTNMKTRKFLIFTLVLGIVMLVFATFIYLDIANGQNSQNIRALIESYGAIILGLVVSFIIVLVAKVFGITRFYYYSLTIFLAFLAVKFVDHNRIIPISFLTCGSIIFLSGLFMFFKFVKTYPRLEAKEND